MKELDQFIKLFARMPGLGPRSAKRCALSLLKRPDTMLAPLIQSMQAMQAVIQTCHICGNIDNKDPCSICTDPLRDQTILCIVEDISDLWALERAGGYKGLYHVLGGSLSALDGVRPEDLNIFALLNRLQHNHGNDHQKENEKIEEIILATNLTVDGQTTAHYISDLIKDRDVHITRLAHGVPIGGELDYLDDGTLRAAMSSRNYLKS